jgi:hypothetical protein
METNRNWFLPQSGYLYYNLGNYKRQEKYLKEVQIALQNNISDIGDTYYNCGMGMKTDSLKLANDITKKNYY